MWDVQHGVGGGRSGPRGVLLAGLAESMSVVRDQGSDDIDGVGFARSGPHRGVAGVVSALFAHVGTLAADGAAGATQAVHGADLLPVGARHVEQSMPEYGAPRSARS